MTSEKDLAAGIERIEKELGALTIAVNNAGIASAERRGDAVEEDGEKLYDVNVTGIFLCCQAEARLMLPRRKGSIVNIASMSGSIVNRGLTQAHYNSSKAAVIHMSRASPWNGRIAACA